MKKRGLLLVLIAVVVGTVMIFASGAGGSSTKSGGTFRIGTSSRIDSLNPYVAFNQDAYSAFMYIYPVLIQYDAANKRFAPDFARSWSTSKDGKTWTFKTVANAKWSDGKPLTAADAAWTINTDIKYKGGGAANAAGLIAHIKRAEAPNPTTLVIHYAAAAGNVLGQFQQFAILPKHIWSKHTGHKGNDLKTFANSAPVVGGGPFTLTKFKKDEIALFQKNKSFYGPKPQVDGFGLRMFSNDDALVAALKANEIDAIEDVPATAIKTLKNAGMNVTNVPGVDQTDFIFNANAKKKDHRELLNPKVREAFDHAINRSKIVQVVFLGTAKPGISIIPPSTGAWFNNTLKPVSFDLNKANKLLDGLGFKKGSDGIRSANGHKMSYQVITPTDVSSVDRTLQILQPDFRKIGVKLGQRGLRRHHGAEREVPELRSRNVGLGRVDRSGLHALGRHLRSVQRLERLGLLRQDVRQDVLAAAAHAGPGQAQGDRLEDAEVPVRQAPVPLAGDARPCERREQEVGRRRQLTTGTVQFAVEAESHAGPPEVTIPRAQP
jgi:peptide/nickel transport system substrate-binding protein